MIFIVKNYAFHLFQQKETLIKEIEATEKMWTQIFKKRTIVEPGSIIMFLEEERISSFSESRNVFGFTNWKVLYEEEIGWIQLSYSNLTVPPQKFPQK